MKRAKNSTVTQIELWEAASRACDILGNCATSTLLYRFISIIAEMWSVDQKANAQLEAFADARLTELAKEILKVKSDKRLIKKWNADRKRMHGLPPLRDPFDSHRIARLVKGGAK